MLLKKRNIYLAILLVLLLVASLCIGCAQENGEDDETADSRKAYSGTTLRLLLKTGYETEAITKYVDEFEEATGIKVEYEVYDEPTVRNKFILDCTGQTGSYDVVTTQFWYMPEYLRAGWLEPLDEYAHDKEWYSAGNIPEGLLGAYRDAEGKLYAVPVSTTGGVLIYRQDLLDKHDLKVPRTTDELLEVARELKAKEPEIYPFSARGDSSSASFGTSVGWAWAYGARVMDEDLNVTVDTPEMKKAMTDFVELMGQLAPPDQASIGWDVMSELYRQGDVALNFEMSGFPSVYANPEVSTVSDKIGVTLVKGPADNYAQWMYGEGLGISKLSKNKEAAWLFIQWRTSLETALKEVADEIRLDFPDSRVYDSEIYAEKTKGKEFFTDLIPDILASVDAAYWPNIAEFEQVAEAFQQQISLATAGKQSVDQALANAQEEIEKIVAAVE